MAGPVANQSQMSSMITLNATAPFPTDSQGADMVSNNIVSNILARRATFFRPAVLHGQTSLTRFRCGLPGSNGTIFWDLAELYFSHFPLAGLILAWTQRC